MVRMLVAAHKHDGSFFPGIRRRLRAKEKHDWIRDLINQ